MLRLCWPSSQDATRTTVHDRREAERSRDRRKVQTSVCGADLRGSSSSLGVSLATRTRGPDTARRKPRPCQEDSCPAQDEANASHTQAWMRSTTRKASFHNLHLSASHTQAWKEDKTLCSDEEPLLLIEEEHPSVAQCWREKTAARSKSSSVRGR